MQSIFLVCSDLAMIDGLSFFLQHSGFQVARAIESGRVVAEIGRGRPDLVVISENERGIDVNELCITIREQSDVPIIVLGHGHDEVAGVRMPEIGADAYLTSPLNARELLASIRSLLRRAHPSKGT